MIKKSTPRKYRLVNIAVKFNQVTDRDANLPLSANEFSEKFADCAISSLIDFFSSYDQVEPDKEFQDFIAFLTLLGLMQIITLVQGAINLVVQFVKIVLKILVLYLYNRAKFFLDNVAIKEPKTIYNNKKVAPGIRQYFFEHIQNLDKVLADLE